VKNFRKKGENKKDIMCQGYDSREEKGRWHQTAQGQGLTVAMIRVRGRGG
jgi:hypothetical protein